MRPLCVDVSDVGLRCAPDWPHCVDPVMCLESSGCYWRAFHMIPLDQMRQKPNPESTMDFITPDPSLYRVTSDGRFMIKKCPPAEGSSLPPTYELYMYARISVGIASSKDAAEEAVRVANERGEVG